MAERPGFMIYLDLFPQLEEYSKTEVGELVFAMRDYVEFGVIPQFEDRGLRVIWHGIQDRLDRDYERYSEEVEKRRVDGKYGHYVKICKARGETPKEKILWLEEDYSPPEEYPQAPSSILKGAQGDLNTHQGRKPTTTTNPKANTTSNPKATANETAAGKGFGGRDVFQSLPSDSNPEDFEQKRQAQMHAFAEHIQQPVKGEQ